NTRGLRGNNVNVYHVNDGSNVIAYHRWDQGGMNDDVVVVLNFSNTEFSEYNVGFPHGGDWHVVMNSDGSAYGLDSDTEDYTDFGATTVTTSANGMDGLSHRGNVPLARYSGYILSRTPLPDDTEPSSHSDVWLAF
ncbi:MAG: alpha amylase C-terminal domain-containing protein, partial [Candidatus Sumerlaeia bacterium]|nr:alpha amylase C-terminal domain-containing protein [Candidatus Sumerlaeia bacterium]